MTLKNISLTTYIVGLLRQNIIDPNLVNRASQFGQWIYGDRPKIVKLLNDKNNFPRISVESVSSITESEIGMSCTEHEEIGSLRINVWTVRDLICTVVSTLDESHVYDSTASNYNLTNLPVSNISTVTGIINTLPYTFIKNTDYQLIDSDEDGFYDSLQWLGNDVPDHTSTFYVSYQRKASTDELCRFISYEINKYLRDNWRLWVDIPIWGYRKTGGNPVEFDNELGVYRYELTCSFSGINIGDSI